VPITLVGFRPEGPFPKHAPGSGGDNDGKSVRRVVTADIARAGPAERALVGMNQ
jgi:hypothetical protein